MAAADVGAQLGMEMARNFGARFVGEALVAKDDAVDNDLVGDLAAPRAAGEPVVIARDPEQPRRCRLTGEPSGDGRNDAAGGVAVVEAVAEAPYRARAGPGRKGGKTVERVVTVVGRQRLAERRITLSVTEQAMALLARVGYDPAFGARPLKRVIQRELGDRAALLVLEGKATEGSTITVSTTPATDLEGEALSVDVSA